VIKASHLSKKYRKKLAVDDLSFEVATGKVTGFLGPNGAGKSTTMRLMLGLDNGKGGTTYDGKKLYEYSEPSQVVGILLEAKAFHPTRSARNHLKILATAGNIPLSRVDEVLDIVGLKEVAKKGPGKFSLGMSQRLGIAAAILGKPTRRSSDLEMSQMADNIIVIGKGKLIINTSMKELVSGSAASTVFVRTNKLPDLQKALTKANVNYVKKDGGLSVAGTKTDEIGKLAFANKITVLELARHTASLEEVFFELTEGSEEYKGHSKESKK
jgi:ABC-2 type transport system ATP-binding protein